MAITDNIQEKIKKAQAAGYSDAQIRTFLQDNGVKDAQIPSKSIVDTVGGVAQKVSDFVGARGLTDLAGSQIAKAGLALSGNMDAANRVVQPSFKDVVGSAIQTGANFIPGVGVGAKLGTKVLAGTGTGYAFDVGSKLQSGKSVGESLVPGVGTAVGAGLPVAAKGVILASDFVGSLLKGMGAALSGVPEKVINTIASNPKSAQEASRLLAQSGNSKLLENNARIIVNGVSQVRQEARQVFGEGLSQLKAEDIQPKTFRDSLKSFLDQYKVSLDQKTNTRFLDNVEFSDPKNLQKASDLIDAVSKTDLNGFSLRSVLAKVENSRFKTATSDERLAFNAFISDFGTAIKKAITDSTDKLGEINAKFSQDMQLAEAVQNIFGKVNFKNLPEVVRASQRLEGLFSQKGLAPDVVQDFLTRIGVEPTAFRMSEAVRQISNRASGSNAPGLSVSEILQHITSAVVTPNLVKNLVIFTGLAEDKLASLLQQITPAATKVLLNAAVQNQDSIQ